MQGNIKAKIDSGLAFTKRQSSKNSINLIAKKTLEDKDKEREQQQAANNA